MKVRFHPAARAELVEARDWYERARAGLGSAFTFEVERVIASIEEQPLPFLDLF